METIVPFISEMNGIGVREFIIFTNMKGSYNKYKMLLNLQNLLRSTTITMMWSLIEKNKVPSYPYGTLCKCNLKYHLVSGN